MDYRYNFKKALLFTKIAVYLGCTWPPPRTATRWDIVRADIAWGISILSVLLLFFPLLYSVYANRSNGFFVAQITIYVGSAANFMIKSVVFRLHRKRTQVLLYEMEDFMNNAQLHEQIILQRYIDRCSPLHKFSTGVTYIGLASVILVLPLIFPDKPLPTKGVYYFQFDTGLLKHLFSIYQSVVAAVYSSGTLIDCQAALMMWFAGARLEMLAEEIMHVTSIEEFQDLIRKHKKLLSYATEASNTMSYIALASISTCGVIAISGALVLFGDQPFFIKAILGLGIPIGGINLLISAWPADNLIYTFELLENAVYNTPWTNMGPNMRNNVLMVIQRCQRPIIVSIGGFVSCLSLRSYMSFISKLFSYFTTLRVVMMSDAGM